MVVVYIFSTICFLSIQQTLSEQDMFVHILTSRDKDIVMNGANLIPNTFSNESLREYLLVSLFFLITADLY